MFLLERIYIYCINISLIQNWFIIRRNSKELRHTFVSIRYLYLVSKILNSFTDANHDEIRKNSLKLIQQSYWIGHFYLAKSLVLQNQSQEAIDQLHQFLEYEPYHTDAIILLSELEYEMGKCSIARNRLYHLLKYSNRRKIWQILSNFVQNRMDFDEFHAAFQKKFPFYMEKIILKDLANHLSNAALRANEMEFALKFWEKQYKLCLTQKSGNPNKYLINMRKIYNDKAATVALTAIKKCLDKSKIPFFLVSGTLLGCIRENKLLSHDKDIDIGVWATMTTVQELKEKIKSGSNCFYILPIYSKDILVIKHVNGIKIDIFIHYREHDNFWHAGGKSKWNNTPFDLKEHYFLGENYLIPINYDLYLTENYGNWRIPKVDFDSALDTLNMEVINVQLMVIYLYKRLIHINNVESELYQRLKISLEYYKKLLI